MTTPENCCISGVCDLHNARNDRLTHLRNLLYEKVKTADALLAEVRERDSWHDTANTIVALDRLDQTVRSAQRTAVELATVSGEQTWAGIGNLLGISRQAAHERFRPQPNRCRFCHAIEGVTSHAGGCDLRP